MQIVAGINLNNLLPRVWDAQSPYYIPQLQAVMVSYADLHRHQALKKRAEENGIHTELAIHQCVKVYLDNGAFYFLNRNGGIPHGDYNDFIVKAKPDWYPIPQDFIPTPQMSAEEQEKCYIKTMQVNNDYEHDGYTPVIHISPFLEMYVDKIKDSTRLITKPGVALGGIVPNLLRTPKSVPYQDILDGLQYVRQTFADKDLHVFGIGGTATLHLAALLKMDSVDSSGWRNRAARGIVQLPGSGDRSIADLGKWRGRKPDAAEWAKLACCQCPACLLHGVTGLKLGGIEGFCNRATHNLWTLLEEARWIEERLAAGTYYEEYSQHLYNSTYRPLIDRLVTAKQERGDL